MNQLSKYFERIFFFFEKTQTCAIATHSILTSPNSGQFFLVSQSVRFEDVESIKYDSTALQSIKETIQRDFDEWKTRWDKRVEC